MCTSVTSVSLSSLVVLVIDLFNLVDNAALESVGIKNSLYEIPGLGNRPVLIKFFPPVKNFHSSLYEIYVEPDTYELQAQAAIAVIEDESENSIKGELLFLQKYPPVGPTIIRGNVSGLPMGKHGLHIHQSGNLREGCRNLGEHFNPQFTQHGGPNDPMRHVGDLGNIEADENGNTEIDIVDLLISLSGGPRGIVGRALVITSEADDFGLGDTESSIISGNPGKPIACAAIVYIR